LQVVSATNVQQCRDRIKKIYGNEENSSKTKNDPGQTKNDLGLPKNGHNKKYKGKGKNSSRRQYPKIHVDENNSWDVKDQNKNSRKLNLSEFPSLPPPPASPERNDQGQTKNDHSQAKNGLCGPRAVEGENSSENYITKNSLTPKNERNSSGKPELPSKLGNSTKRGCWNNLDALVSPQSTKKNHHKQPSGYASQN